MRLSKEQVIIILNNAKVDDWGTHQVSGWDKWFDSWRIDNIKITVDQKTESPRPKTRQDRLIKEIQKAFELYRIEIMIDHFGNMREQVLDPCGVEPLLKYLKNKNLQIELWKIENEAV